MRLVLSRVEVITAVIICTKCLTQNFRGRGVLQEPELRRLSPVLGTPEAGPSSVDSEHTVVEVARRA